MEVTPLLLCDPTAIADNYIQPLGFNVIFELIFTDKVSWMVRIPIPTNCFEPEDCTLTYASTLKYLKQHSRLPVPQVFGYDLKSNPQNPANVTYIFMERLSGRQCPTFDSIELDDPPEDVAAALKIHEQMTDIILELGSLCLVKEELLACL